MIPWLPFQPEELLFLCVSTPLIAALTLPFTRTVSFLRDGISLTLSLCLFALVQSLLAHSQSNPWQSGLWPELMLASFLPGLPLSLKLEPLGLTFACLVATLWPLTTLYAIGYMRANNELHLFRFFSLIAIAIAATMAIALSANLLTLFIAYEILTLSTYPLVNHHGSDKSTRSARTYLAILLGSSLALLLPAILTVWQQTGNLTFTPGGNSLLQALPWIGGYGGALLFSAFCWGTAKAALMPLHRWLPSAMVAPVPVSALLHAVAVVKSGVFILIKLTLFLWGAEWLQTQPWHLILSWAAIFTCLAASIIAITKSDIKARLAYSTVAQLAIILLATGLATQTAIHAATLHLLAHATAKITLFFGAGAIYTAHHFKDITQLNGLARRMPITFAAITIASLSLIGFPLTNGFSSKSHILTALIEANQLPLALLFLLSTALTAAYLLPLLWRAYFLPIAHKQRTYAEAPWPMLLAILATALLCLVPLTRLIP